MSNFTAIDFETATGSRNSICQVGLVVVENCQIVDRISYLVKPPGNIYHPRNIEIHGITPEQTENAEHFYHLYYDKNIANFLSGKNVVSHNAKFDMDCLQKTMEYYKIPYLRHVKWFCTYKIYGQKLPDLCKKYGIETKSHDALHDAEACALLMIRDILNQK